MVSQDVIVFLPEGAPRQLFLLLHGYGSGAADLAPLGRFLARTFQQAAIVSLQAPTPCGAGAGWQWYGLSDSGGSIAAAQARGDAAAASAAAAALRRRGADVALPGLSAQIAHWQERCQVRPYATLLLGFSQGAGMALEYCVRQAQQQVPPQDGHAEAYLGRVVAICGRFATLPKRAPARTFIHFLHGEDDAVVSAQHSLDGAERIVQLGGDAIVDTVPGAGHEITPGMLTLLLQRLQGYIPRHVWNDALHADPAQQSWH